MALTPPPLVIRVVASWVLERAALPACNASAGGRSLRLADEVAKQTRVADRGAGSTATDARD